MNTTTTRKTEKGIGYYPIPNGKGKVLHTDGRVEYITVSGWVWTLAGAVYIEEK